MSVAVGRELYAPGDANLVFLNSATTGLPSQQTRDAMVQFVHDWHTAGGAGWKQWEQASTTARDCLGQLLHCSSDRIALLGSASSALALALHSFVLPTAGEKRTTFVCGASDFSSIPLPMKAALRHTDRLRLVPFRNNQLHLDDLLQAIDETTAMVAVSHVQSASGFLLDVTALERHCVEQGAALFVDVTQSLGAIAVPTLHHSFIGGAGYKWLTGPKGCGFLRPPLNVDLSDVQPLWPNWNATEEQHNGYYGVTPFSSCARRFDSSTVWIVAVGFAAALQTLTSLEGVLERCAFLAQFLRREAQRLHLPFLFANEPQQVAPIVSITVDGNNAQELCGELAKQNIACSARDGFVRISAHFYNTNEEVTKGLEALAVLMNDLKK